MNCNIYSCSLYNHLQVGFCLPNRLNLFLSRSAVTLNLLGPYITLTLLITLLSWNIFTWPLRHNYLLVLYQHHWLLLPGLPNSKCCLAWQLRLQTSSSSSTLSHKVVSSSFLVLQTISYTDDTKLLHFPWPPHLYLIGISTWPKLNFWFLPTTYSSCSFPQLSKYQLHPFSWSGQNVWSHPSLFSYPYTPCSICHKSC